VLCVHRFALQALDHHNIGSNPILEIDKLSSALPTHEKICRHAIEKPLSDGDNLRQKLAWKLQATQQAQLQAISSTQYIIIYFIINREVASSKLPAVELCSVFNQRRARRSLPLPTLLASKKYPSYCQTDRLLEQVQRAPRSTLRRWMVPHAQKFDGRMSASFINLNMNDGI
jgi:hypothetical protein